MDKTNSKLSSKKRYLQIALNSTIEEAYKIIPQLPVSDRILIEAGTPFIKRYGEEGNQVENHKIFMMNLNEYVLQQNMQRNLGLELMQDTV